MNTADVVRDVATVIKANRGVDPFEIPAVVEPMSVAEAALAAVIEAADGDQVLAVEMVDLIARIFKRGVYRCGVRRGAVEGPRERIAGSLKPLGCGRLFVPHGVRSPRSGDYVAWCARCQSGRRAHGYSTKRARTTRNGS